MHNIIPLAEINMVCSYRTHSQTTGDKHPQSRFCIEFPEEFIEKNSDGIEKISGHQYLTYRYNRSIIFSQTAGPEKSGISAHLTPTVARWH